MGIPQGQRLLLALYQKRQLIVELALPCEMNAEAKCLEKLKEFNTSLHLNAVECHNEGFGDNL